MAPCKPRDINAGENPGSFFGGAVTFEYLDPPPPERAFAIRATFPPNMGPPPPPPPPPAGKKPKKLREFPKPHFHPDQVEYFHVERGSLTVHQDGQEHIVTPASGDGHTVPAGAVHWVESTHGDPAGVTVVASADAEGSPYQLDRAFFENWLTYQSEGAKYGFGADMLQVHAMWDAGDCVLPLPKWVPGGKKLARWRGVVLGRWIGGALGYQPFYEEWTSDWELACSKMERSIFQRRFVKRSRKKAAAAAAAAAAGKMV
ncbi:hypothetical protein EDC01DRAFT_619938 [Geopyxis carbonaria]|nr:hypothetical protein EDC01DRAFT_619938 [Geopyxis carbonaria]